MLEQCKRLEGQKRILKSCPPTGKADRSELGETPLADRLADLLHEPAVEGHIMQRQQNRTQHLIRQKQMVQIASAKMTAGITLTIGLNRCGISLVAGIAQAQGALHCESRCIAAIASRQN